MLKKSLLFVAAGILALIVLIAIFYRTTSKKTEPENTIPAATQTTDNILTSSPALTNTTPSPDASSLIQTLKSPPAQPPDASSLIQTLKSPPAQPPDTDISSSTNSLKTLQ